MINTKDDNLEKETNTIKTVIRKNLTLIHVCDKICFSPNSMNIFFIFPKFRLKKKQSKLSMKITSYPCMGFEWTN